MTNAPKRRLPRRVLAGAIASAILWAASFHPLAAGPLIFLAPAPVVAVLWEARASWRVAMRAGYAFGAATFLLLLWWVARLVPSAEVTIPGLMLPAVALLVAYLAVFPALWLAGVAALARWRTVPTLLAVPSMAVAVEWIRASGPLGFPWGAPGYALTTAPRFAQAASLGGVLLVHALVATVAVLLAAAFAHRARGSRAVAFAAAAVALVGALAAWGGGAMERAMRPDARELRVGVVQPDVDLALKWKESFRDSTLRLITRLDLEASAAGAEFVVFPETCAPVYLRDAPDYRARLAGLAMRTGAPVYIGFLDWRRDGPGGEINVYNASGVFRADGSLVTYDKVHLLPFGEALPGSSRWRWLKHIQFGQANFDPGRRRAPLDAGVARFTPLICFESVFADLCRDGVRRGSQLFVNVTNDGWFGRTPGPWQHAYMAVMRSIEFRRWLVRSANTGVSMVVAPDGTVRAERGLFEPAILVEPVRLRDDLTPYARHGDAPVLYGVLLLLLLSGAGARWGTGRYSTLD